MIGIRADANDIVATGHMMRCITIAKQLKQKGGTVCFFIADSYGAPMLEAAEMDYVCLNTKWNSLEEELPILLTELEHKGCDKLLIDSYQVTSRYLEELRKKCKIIYIDDMFERIYPVNMIINYNAYHTNFPYREAYGSEVKLLLGTSYVPLREEFSDGSYVNSDEENKEKSHHVLLSCGGGDVHNVLAGILKEAVTRDEFKDTVFHTIVGGFNRNVEELERLSEMCGQIVLYYNVNNMAELMSQCEVAVSAAGTMLFELCAMQVPTVFFASADNQKYDSDFFEKDNIMLFAGDIRSNREECVGKICDKLTLLLLDIKLQEELKKRMHQVADGNGASRIAEEIISL